MGVCCCVHIDSKECRRRSHSRPQIRTPLHEPVSVLPPRRESFNSLPFFLLALFISPPRSPITPFILQPTKQTTSNSDHLCRLARLRGDARTRSSSSARRCAKSTSDRSRTSSMRRRRRGPRRTALWGRMTRWRIRSRRARWAWSGWRISSSGGRSWKRPRRGKLREPVN